MIWESSYWKDELLQMAAYLKVRKRASRWPPSSTAKVERTVMVGFYMVRKLIDASKLSDDVAEKQLPLQEHPPTGKRVTWMNSHRLEDLFDLVTVTDRTGPLRFVCNQMVHSYAFAMVLDEDALGLAGLLFASDFQKSRSLLYITVDDIIDVFTLVGNDYPDKIQTVWNPEREDYDVSSQSTDWWREDVP